MKRWVPLLLMLLAMLAPQAWGYTPEQKEYLWDGARNSPAGAATEDLGTTRLFPNPTRGVLNAFVYDAWGTLIGSNGSPQTAYLYTGEQFDPHLGFYYLRARYLNTGTGRFWTRDSWEGNQSDPLSLHKYLYAHDNPVNGWDPSGYSFASELGTKVHTFLAQRWEARDYRLGVGLGGMRWGNRQIRTIYRAITDNPLLNAPPFTFRPDLAEIDSKNPRIVYPTKGYLYEIKPGILSLVANPGLLQQELMDAVIQLSGYLILNSLTQDIWERGRLGEPGMQIWEDFTYNPPGTYLVTLDVSASVPGIIIYEFLPTNEALEYVAAGAAVGVGAAIAERYGVSAAIKIAVRGAIQAGSRAAAAYLETGLYTRTAAATLTHGF